MKTSRTTYAIKNSIYSVVAQAINIIIKFALRIIFIKTLGSEYLGVNGVFTNILSMLSLAELGLGTAIIYDMYKPISENDTKKIVSYTHLYKKIYAIIGVIILILGIALIPFLDKVVTNVPNVENITLIYIMFLLDTILTYFFAHYRSLVSAYQMGYINTTNTIIFNIMKAITQIIILLIFKNFILYLVIQIVYNVLSNIFISIKVKKVFPFLKNTDIQPISKNKILDILKNSLSLFSIKVSATIMNSTDNVLISSFIGTNIVGMYSNYNLIITTVQQTIFLVVNSLQASIGNLCAAETKEKCMNVFFNLLFTYSWIYCLFSTILCAISSDFVLIFFGNEYIMKDIVIYIVIFNFYLAGIRQAVSGFYTANGLFKYFKVSSILEVIINIVISVLLVKLIGLSGIFLGTTITQICIRVWYEPYILFKYGFQERLKKYFHKYCIYVLVNIVSICITQTIILTFFKDSNFVLMIIKGIIAFFIPNVIYISLFYKSEEIKYTNGLIKKLIQKIKRK